MNKGRLNLTKFQISILTILAIGIFFRFFNLGQKFYWHDEVYTSLRLSGYTKVEMVEQLYQGQITSVEDLQKYQGTNAEKGVADTVNGLAIEEPQHPPLYYTASRIWVQIFGDSVGAIRSFAAACSLLVFPSLYWLCWELFQSPIVGAIAIGLVAVSPFHILYAQEARQYSLWTAIILMSGAALLKALRWENQDKTARDRVTAWAVYAATLALGFYTHLLSGFVAVSHGIYVVLATQRKRWLKTVRNYFIASIAAFIAFIPWVIIILANKAVAQDTTNWTTDRESRLKIAKTFARNFVSLFADFQAGHDYINPNFNLSNPLTYLAIPIFCLLVYALYVLIRRTPKTVWLFLAIPAGMALILFMLPDLILGTRRSADRYLIPLYLSLQISVAYLFATHLQPIAKRSSQQTLWKMMIAALFSLGVLSACLSSQADTWSNKSYEIPQIARTINQSRAPLIVNDRGRKTYGVGNVISLSYRLHSQTKFLLVADAKETIAALSENAANFSDIYLFEPTQKLRDDLSQVYELKPLSKHKKRLWLLGEL